VKTPSARSRSALALLLVLAGAVGLAVLLASGALTPAPASGPVPLPSVAAAGTQPPLAPSLTPAPSATPRVTSPTKSAAPSPPLPLDYVVARRIVIPAVGIDLPIYSGDGLTAQLGKVAHYPTTSWPGGGGLIYLYGHARDGNLIGLWKARVGDRIDLVLDNGATATYEIVKVRPEVKWNDLSMLAPTKSEILRLQTCTSYEGTAPRFVVDAKPIAPTS
jgi:LPXTG-site transpeptidase (sortase) family protein